MKTIAVTPDLLKEVEKLKPYDQEYGFLVRNLFAVVENQFTLLYDAIDKLGLGSKERDRILQVLWQTQDLVNLIDTKVDDEMFLSIDNLIFEIKKE